MTHQYENWPVDLPERDDSSIHWTIETMTPNPESMTQFNPHVILILNGLPEEPMFVFEDPERTILELKEDAINFIMHIRSAPIKEVN